MTLDKYLTIAECLPKEQEPCEITAEEYRQRMIQAFHNADTDELIAICVPPTEKEFEHLEWLLKNHYKKEPCEDAISRQYLQKQFQDKCETDCLVCDYDSPYGCCLIDNAPSVMPKQRWISVGERLPEENKTVIASTKYGVYPETRYTKENGWEWAYESYADYWVKLEYVTAWMPLPKLYEPQESEEV